jgi:hypothetical protein
VVSCDRIGKSERLCRLILQPRMIGLAGSVASLPQGGDCQISQHRYQLEKDFGRGDGITQSRVPPDDADSQTLRDAFQVVALLTRVRHCRQEQDIQYRIDECNARGSFFDLQHAHVKGRVVRHQDRIFGKSVKRGQHRFNGRLAQGTGRRGSISWSKNSL